jgi:hypothetical protein
MTGRSLWILGLVGALVLTVMSMAAEAGSSRSSRTQYDRTVSGLTEQHLRTKRTHHRGRSFLERRAVTRRDPLPGHRASEPPRLSNSDLSRAYSSRAQAAPSHGVRALAPGCRPVSRLALEDGRRAIVGHHLCDDGFGSTYIAPGSRHVIVYLDGPPSRSPPE